MDTTAHTLAFALYALAANPSVQKRAQTEMDLFTANSNHPDPCSGNGIPSYVDAILKESMRKYPTAATGSFRRVRDGGYQLTPDVFLPEGTWVLINIFSLQNSTKIWGQDAKQFKPERFLSLSSEAALGSIDTPPPESSIGDGQSGSSIKYPLSSHAAFAGVGHTSDDVVFIPFSYGIRNCIGMNLALMELRVGLCEFIAKFHFELADPRMQDDNFMFETAFTSRPVNGLPVFISQRKF